MTIRKKNRILLVVAICLIAAIAAITLYSTAFSTSRLEGDYYVAGNFSSTTLNIPAGTVTNAMVNANADIAASKLEHPICKTFSQNSAVTAADQTLVVHGVRGATGTTIAFEVGCVVANIGDSTVAFDLLKGGVSVLSAAVTVDSGDAARAIVAGTISTATLADGDVLELSIDATVGTGTLGKGAFATVFIYEDSD